MKNSPLQTFFNLCTFANIFFPKCKLMFVTHIMLQAIYFVFFMPCKQFFQYFSFLLQKNNGPSLTCFQKKKTLAISS